MCEYHMTSWMAIQHFWGDVHDSIICSIDDHMLRLYMASLNILRPGQNGRHFTDDIFKCIFLNENVWIAIKVLLNFVRNRPISFF